MSPNMPSWSEACMVTVGCGRGWTHYQTGNTAPTAGSDGRACPVASYNAAENSFTAGVYLKSGN